jgi:hypothetical protein
MSGNEPSKLKAAYQHPTQFRAYRQQCPTTFNPNLPRQTPRGLLPKVQQALTETQRYIGVAGGFIDDMQADIDMVYDRRCAASGGERRDCSVL